MDPTPILDPRIFFPHLSSLAKASDAAAVIIGYIGIAIILIGCVKGVLYFTARYLGFRHYLGEIRIELGQHLALGLEFLVGKDIIESLVQPTWDELGKLAAIIAIRTVLTLFVSRELKEVREEIKDESLVTKLFGSSPLKRSTKRKVAVS